MRGSRRLLTTTPSLRTALPALGIDEPAGAATRPSWQRDLRAWYLAHARGLVGDERELLDEPARAPISPIGVLGLTGVGKSSLLNAVIQPGVQLLPAGGVGPLTGLPVRLEVAPSGALTVRYRGRAWLHDVLARLHGECASETELGNLSLLCTGDQYRTRDPHWLLAALRHALRPDLNPAPDDDPTTVTSLRCLHAALASSGECLTWSACAPAELFQQIRLHCGGQLAPLCDEVRIAWPTIGLPANAVLVDLPGLGTIHDLHARQTEAWLSHARAALVVVDRAGLPDALATVLRTSGFLDRWRAGVAELAVAITKLDLVADDDRRRARDRSWATHYFDACTRATTQMRAQLASVLDHAALVSRIRIVAVSSRERHRLARADDVDPPRLRSPASTGVPDLTRALGALVRLGQPLAHAIDVALHATPATDLQLQWTSFLDKDGPP